MSKESYVSKALYSFLPTDVEAFDSLAELALVVEPRRRPSLAPA